VGFRGMGEFADVAESDLTRCGTGDGEPDGIPVAGWRKMRAGCRVAEVAVIAQESSVRSGLVLRFGPVARATTSPPACAQRETRRMRPGDVVDDFARHEVGAGQVVLQGKAIVARRGSSRFSVKANPRNANDC